MRLHQRPVGAAQDVHLVPMVLLKVALFELVLDAQFGHLVLVPHLVELARLQALSHLDLVALLDRGHVLLVSVLHKRTFHSAAQLTLTRHPHVLVAALSLFIDVSALE